MNTVWTCGIYRVKTPQWIKGEPLCPRCGKSLTLTLEKEDEVHPGPIGPDHGGRRDSGG